MDKYVLSSHKKQKLENPEEEEKPRQDEMDESMDRLELESNMSMVDVEQPQLS